MYTEISQLPYFVSCADKKRTHFTFHHTFISINFIGKMFTNIRAAHKNEGSKLQSALHKWLTPPPHVASGATGRDYFTKARFTCNTYNSSIFIVILIIDVHMGMENARTGLKSSRPLDRADYLQTGTSPEQDECEHKYISDRSQLRSLLRNNACSTKRFKNNNGRQGE